jgi:hypothetical protein
MFHTVGSTAFKLLEMLNAGGTTADAIMEFFAPICPCDPGEYIKIKLQQNDPEIVGIIEDLILRPVVTEPSLAPSIPWVGFMISSLCTGGVLTGTFADGAGSTYTSQIPLSTPC